jgi:hypothetical protein
VAVAHAVQAMMRSMRDDAGAGSLPAAQAPEPPPASQQVRPRDFSSGAAAIRRFKGVQSRNGRLNSDT